MSDEIAEVGDTIEITYNTPFWRGKKVVVVKRPDDATEGNQPGDTWFWSKDQKKPLYFSQEDYRIVQRANEQDTTNHVDASLKSQLNDNLRSIFG